MWKSLFGGKFSCNLPILIGLFGHLAYFMLLVVLIRCGWGASKMFCFLIILFDWPIKKIWNKGLFGNMKENNILLSSKLMKDVFPYGKMIFIIVKICRCHEIAPQQSINLFLSSLPTFYHPTFIMVLIFFCLLVGSWAHHGAYIVFLLLCYALCIHHCFLVFVLSLALVVVLILSLCFHVGPCANAMFIVVIVFMLGHVLTMESIWSSYFCVGPCALMICIQPTKCTSN